MFKFVEFSWGVLFDIFFTICSLYVRGRGRGEGNPRQIMSLAVSTASATGACEPRENEVGELLSDCVV